MLSMARRCISISQEALNAPFCLLFDGAFALLMDSGISSPSKSPSRYGDADLPDSEGNLLVRVKYHGVNISNRDVNGRNTHLGFEGTFLDEPLRVPFIPIHPLKCGAYLAEATYRTHT